MYGETEGLKIVGVVVFEYADLVTKSGRKNKKKIEKIDGRFTHRPMLVSESNIQLFSQALPIPAAIHLYVR